MGVVALKNQLFESVAVDPTVAKDYVSSLILKHKFGLGSGRFIAGIPRDWSSYALQQINTLTDESMRKRLKEILRAIEMSGATVPQSVPFDRSKPWLNEATGPASRSSIDVLITDGQADFEPRFPSADIDSYVDQSDDRVGYLDVSRLSRGNEFVPFLAPFLKKHKKIVLVNRHQWLLSSRKSKDLFETVFRFWLGEDGTDFTVIRSSLEMRDDPRPFSSNWDLEKKLLSEFLSRCQFKGTFRFLAVNDSSDRLHHRYLLGNYCGISMDYGLEIVEKPHPWQLLNRAHFIEAREKFFLRDATQIYPDCCSFVYAEKGRRISEK